MVRYAVEVFATELGESGHQAQVARVREAAHAVAAEGSDVRYLLSLFMPADELCLHLFESPSADTVRATATRARLDPLRLVETMTVPDLDARGDAGEQRRWS